MIDHDNLRTASLYINNQLLSRGLLRDGQGIDFADPKNGSGGEATTLGRIISVVNDLILRRDLATTQRDAENRESLAATLRTLRAEALHNADTIARLRERGHESQRRLALADAAEAQLRLQLQSAEAAVRTLREEVSRAKSNVAQTRAACAVETRKRDRQIDGLKKQLAEAGRSRGTARASPGAIVISSVPGETTIDLPAESAPSESGHDLYHVAYDLRSETNEFLAALARSLGEENDHLLELIRQTRDRLRLMSGWSGAAAADHDEDEDEDDDDKEEDLYCGDTSDRQRRQQRRRRRQQRRQRQQQQRQQCDPDVVVTQPGRRDLARDLEIVAEHLRTILTNPSFVPIEEVVVREAEISRLREGWVKMESRWREAVHLIDGWRRRMATSGRPVDEEDLKMGLRLSPVRVRNVEETQAAVHGSGLLRLAAVPEETGEIFSEGEENGGGESEGAAEEDQKQGAGESLHLVPAPGIGDGSGECLDEDGRDGGDDEGDGGSDHRSSDDESSIGDDDGDEFADEELNVHILQQSSLLVEPPLLLQPRLSPPPPLLDLGPLQVSSSAGNRGAGGTSSARMPASDPARPFGNLRPAKTRATTRTAKLGEIAAVTGENGAPRGSVPEMTGAGDSQDGAAAATPAKSDKSEDRVTGTHKKAAPAAALEKERPPARQPQRPVTRAGGGPKLKAAAAAAQPAQSRAPPNPTRGQKAKAGGQPQSQHASGAAAAVAARRVAARLPPKPATSSSSTLSSLGRQSQDKTQDKENVNVVEEAEAGDISSETAELVRPSLTEVAPPPASLAGSSRQQQEQPTCAVAAPAAAAAKPIAVARTGGGAGTAQSAARPGRKQPPTKPLELKKDLKDRPLPVPPSPKSPIGNSSPLLPSSSPKCQAGVAAMHQQQQPPSTPSKSTVALVITAADTAIEPPPPPPATLLHRPASPPRTDSCGSSSSSRPPLVPAPVPAPPPTPTVVNSSRLPLPRPAAPQQSPITLAAIAAKLEASERQADAARVKAKLRAARMADSKKAPTLAPPTPSAPTTTAILASPARETVSPTKRGRVGRPDAPLAIAAAAAAAAVAAVPVAAAAADDDDADELALGEENLVIKRTRQSPRRKRERRLGSKAANRRRSTLSPWELQSLITGGGAPPVPDIPAAAAAAAL